METEKKADFVLENSPEALEEKVLEEFSGIDTSGLEVEEEELIQDQALVGDTTLIVENVQVVISKIDFYKRGYGEIKFKIKSTNK